MAVSAQFRDFVAEQMSGLGGITVRAMFGGIGVFRDGLMFALIDNTEQLYLKADDENRGDFEAEGMTRFTTGDRARRASMPYWQAPERLYDDPDEMALWAGKAYAAALRAAGKKKKKSPEE